MFCVAQNAFGKAKKAVLGHWERCFPRTRGRKLQLAQGLTTPKMERWGTYYI